MSRIVELGSADEKNPSVSRSTGDAITRLRHGL